MRALALALGLMAAPAAAAESQFDLICKAKKTEVRYRVDLARGEWCLERCDNVNKIAEVTSGTLTLYDEKPTGPNGPYSWMRINRANGEWQAMSWEPSYSSADSRQGVCALAPFTGFPTTKF